MKIILVTPAQLNRQKNIADTFGEIELTIDSDYDASNTESNWDSYFGNIPLSVVID